MRRSGAAGGPRVARRASRKSWRARLGAWRDQHLYSLFSSLGRLVRRPVATFLTVAVMGIALALPLILLLLLGNVERLSGDFREAREISLFLLPDAALSGPGAPATLLAEDPEVAAVLLRTPEEGLAEMRSLAGYAEVLELLDANPLPAVLVVTPTATANPQLLVQRLGQLPGVDFVQHDAQWRARLVAWLELGHRIALVAGLLLGLGALLVVGNTVRLDIQGRVEEIRVLQLLGATDGFVRRPFLYLGAWYGLAAGVLALLVAASVPQWVRAPIAALMDSYGSRFEMSGPDFNMALLALVASALLGWLGAWLATSHHLYRHATEQRPD